MATYPAKRGALRAVSLMMTALALAAAVAPLAAAVSAPIPCTAFPFNLNTGRLGTGVLDVWDVTSAPSGVVPLAFGVTTAGTPWMAPPPGANWITTNWNLLPANAQATSAPLGDWNYRYTFAPGCPGSWAPINLCVLADDAFAVSLNGGGVLFAKALGAFTPPPTCYTGTVLTTSGLNHIDIKVSNLFPIHQGLLAYGSITA